MSTFFSMSGSSPPAVAQRGILRAAVPSQKRGKTMTRRSGQSGTVVKKGRMWHGRFYADVAGQAERKHMSVPLGLVKELTKSEARRKLQAMLQDLGINTAAHLEQAVHGMTFRKQAEWWKENRLSLMKESTQHVMTGYLNKYLLPRFAALPVADIDGKRAQEFITELVRAPLAPKTIQTVVGTLKLVIGKKAWRDWDVAMPRQERKEQRFFTPEEMGRIIEAGLGKWKVIFTLLAGTGIRGGECGGLHVEDVNLTANTITIRRGSWHGRETTPKTEAAYRVINFDGGVADVLRQHIAGRTGGQLFTTQVGTLVTTDLIRKKLQATLRRLGIPKGGAHAFRHGRVSVLRAHGVPDDLVKEWVGHSSLKMTSRYTHFQDAFKQQAVNGLVISPRVPKPVTSNLSFYEAN